jgi:hypothetical protein
MHIVALLVVTSLLLAGCQHVEQMRPPASTFCMIARPITWSSRDTRATKTQIDAFNRTWKRLCAGKR